MSLIVFVEFWNYWKWAINNSNVEVNRLEGCQKYTNFYLHVYLNAFLPGDCSDDFWRTLGKLTALEGACQINRLKKDDYQLRIIELVNFKIFTYVSVASFLYAIDKKLTFYLKVTKVTNDQLWFKVG